MNNKKKYTLVDFVIRMLHRSCDVVGLFESFTLVSELQIYEICIYVNIYIMYIVGVCLCVWRIS